MYAEVANVFFSMTRTAPRRAALPLYRMRRLCGAALKRR